MIELLKHNKETYKRLCEVLEINNKCALVQATGTGKSYIAGKYIEEHADTALILVPTNAIADAWSDLLKGIEQEVDIITYQAFAKEPDNYLEYDLVIADEMHHLGSDVWGKKFVETYLQSENHKIIGLTATEIRYLDNSRDMAEEIFDNVRVDGCDLPTAINTSVLPTFKYVSALYCDESDFDEWKAKAGKIKDIKTQNELKGRLDVCIKNMVSVKQAVNENLTDDYKKIIVFLNNVESKETALEMFKDVFPTANFYDVDYGKSRTENNSQIGKFKADSDRAVLFAVDMLNEGIHVKGTDCIIMFRKTVSPQVYLQQLGRGLATDSNKMPVIFDFVRNVNNMGIRTNTKECGGIIRFWNRKIVKEKKIIFKTYVSEINGIIENILDNLGANWTSKDDDFIRENYENMKVSEIAKHLNRPQSSVSWRCRYLGFKKRETGYKKRKNDLSALESYKDFENKSMYEIAEETGITYATVTRYVKERNIKTKFADKNFDEVSEQSKKYILENYAGKTLKELSEEVGCSQTTVYKILANNNIHTSKKITTDEEEKEIINLIKQGESYSCIARKFSFTVAVITRIAKENEIQSAHCGLSSPKPVVQMDKDGKYIKTYNSARQAENELEFVRKEKMIRDCANGKTKTAYGYKWLYEEDYQKMIAEQKGGN